MSRQNDAAAVAEFLRTRGVTRCPTVCAGPTQATIPVGDRDALKRHAEAREEERLARSPMHRRKLAAPAATAPAG